MTSTPVFVLVQFIGQLQKKHNCGSFELLSKTAPIQAASLAALGPFVDYLLIKRNVFDYKMTLGAFVSNYGSLISILALLISLLVFKLSGHNEILKFYVLTTCVEGENHLQPTIFILQNLSRFSFQVSYLTVFEY